MTINECPRCKSLTADAVCDCAGGKDPDPLGLDGYDPATKQFDGTLDCRTPVGRHWIARQHEVVAALAREWNTSAIVTPDTEAAAIDVLFAREGQLVGLAEIKSRNLTLDGLRQMGSYLITHQKLLEGAALARALRVPFSLAVGLTDAVVWWRITDAGGRFVAQFRVEKTTTQETCNGGTATRDNAYIDLGAMQVLDQRSVLDQTIVPAPTRKPFTFSPPITKEWTEQAAREEVGDPTTGAGPGLILEIEQDDGTFKAVADLKAFDLDAVQQATDDALDPSLWE